MTIRDEARQEAERRWPVDWVLHSNAFIMEQRFARRAFRAGVDWAFEQPDREPSDATLKESAPDLTRPGDMRSDFAYPSDAEVEAAAKALAKWDGIDWLMSDGEWQESAQITRDGYRNGARMALLAAQEVRGRD